MAQVSVRLVPPSKVVSNTCYRSSSYRIPQMQPLTIRGVKGPDFKAFKDASTICSLVPWRPLELMNHIKQSGHICQCSPHFTQKSKADLERSPEH